MGANLTNFNEFWMEVVVLQPPIDPCTAAHRALILTELQHVVLFMF